jgi:adapter protein MecA 1/2
MYSGESTLYRCRDTYYLSLTRSSVQSPESKQLEICLGEYGSKIGNINFYDGYLNEYGEKIIDGNALEVLRLYF